MPPAAQPAPGTPSLEERIQKDGSFALEQYKKVKGDADRVYQKAKALEPVSKIVDQVPGGAAQVAAYIHEYDALLADPEVKRRADHYRATGTLPPASSSRPSDAFDYDAEPENPKVTALEQRLNAVTAQLAETRQSVGKQNISSMLDKLKAEFPDGFDEFVVPHVGGKIAELEQTPQGRDVLNSLNYEQLKSVASRAVVDNLDAVTTLRQKRMHESLGRRDTGSPSGTLTTGREPAAAVSFLRGRALIEEFERRHGKLPGR